MRISVWTVIGPNMMNAYNNRYAAENADPPEDYNGPMDDDSYAILITQIDTAHVQPMYKTKSVNGNNPFTLFNMNFVDEAQAIESMDYLDATWPGNQIEIEGAWSWDTGLQMGQSFTYDVDGNLTGVTGTPVYPLSTTAYQLMPDLIEYDDEGNVISTTPATSNLDLRDINLVAGQSPRLFSNFTSLILLAGFSGGATTGYRA
jgi:hypothetical protein